MSRRCAAAQPFSEIQLKAAHLWCDGGWTACFHDSETTLHVHGFIFTSGNVTQKVSFELYNRQLACYCAGGEPQWRFNELMLYNMTTGLDPSPLPTPPLPPPLAMGTAGTNTCTQWNPRPGSSSHSVLWEETWRRRKSEHKDDAAWTLPGFNGTTVTDNLHVCHFRPVVATLNADRQQQPGRPGESGGKGSDVRQLQQKTFGPKDVV